MGSWRNPEILCVRCAGEFSRAFQKLQVFPRLPPVTRFPAQSYHYLEGFTRGCQWLQVFP